MSMTVSVWFGIPLLRRDHARTQRKRCIRQCVDVRSLAPMSSMVVALCARSCRRSCGCIFAARLRLPAICRSSWVDGVVVIVGRRVVEAGFKRA